MPGKVILLARFLYCFHFRLNFVRFVIMQVREDFNSRVTWLWRRYPPVGASAVGSPRPVLRLTIAGNLSSSGAGS